MSNFDEGFGSAFVACCGFGADGCGAGMTGCSAGAAGCGLFAAGAVCSAGVVGCGFTGVGSMVGSVIGVGSMALFRMSSAGAVTWAAP